MDTNEASGQVGQMESSQASSLNSATATSSLSSSSSATTTPASAPSHSGHQLKDDISASAEINSEKADAILAACSSRRIDELKALAVLPGGFLSDAIRRQAWPVLLGYSDSSDHVGGCRDNGDTDEKHQDENVNDGAWKNLSRHRDEHQVKLDVDRSFIYYPNNETQASLSLKKADLSDLITSVLRQQPHLCYFQGYHDICQVFLLVLPPQLRYLAVARLSALRIRDFMLPSLDPAVAQLKLIPSILRHADRALCAHLSHTQPFFALSGTLTMYAHDIQRYDDIARLFDALLAREQVFAVYVFAQIVLSRKAELFDTPADEPEMLHSILSKLPQPLDLDKLIADSVALFERFPPETLGAPWRGIGGASVLKTARDVERCSRQSLDDGKVFFDRQVKQLEWAEKKKRMLVAAWRYRQPAGTVAVAVLVGVLAVCLRKSPGLWGNLVAFSSRWFSS